MISLFKMPDGQEFLCYGEKMEFPENFGITLEKEDINLADYITLPLMSFEQLILRTLIKGKRTTDKILSEKGIESFQDLQFAHFCIMQKISSFSKRERELIEQKYSEVVDYYNPEGLSSEESIKEETDEFK